MPSKLGSHILNGVDGSRLMIQAGCRIVKFVSQYDQVSLVTDPSVLVIGRENTDPPWAMDQFNQGLSPADAAHQFVYDIRNKLGKTRYDIYRENPRIKFWEGHNEPATLDHASQAWYGQMEIERMKLMDALGLKCVIGNFATGNPPDELWGDFVPAVRYARDNGHLLGLHEYSSPWIWWMTGGFQIQHDASGKELSWNDYDRSKLWAGGEGWTTLRYRHAINQFFAPAGCGDVKIVITEFGLDGVSPVPIGTSTGSWRKNRDQFWNRWDGASDPIDYWRGGERDPERYYAEQLIWYDSELRKDANVLGATIFTVGSFGGTWGEFDIAGTRVVDRLCDYIRGQASVIDAPLIEVPPMVEIRRAWGIDTSSHKVNSQGLPPKWDLVKQTGAKFVIGRVSGAFSDTLTNFVDTIWKDTESKVREQGIVLGGYHYWQPLADPIAQAQIFRSTFDIRIGDFPPIVDVEENSGIGESVTLENLIRFVLEVEKLFGMTPIFYTNYSYPTLLQRRYADLSSIPLLLKYRLSSDWMKKYPLWMSLPTEDSNIPNPPSIPAMWAGKWKLWQTSWTGRVAGVQNGQGDVDMNWYNGSDAQMKEWIASMWSAIPVVIPPPVPTPLDPKVTALFGAVNDPVWRDVTGNVLFALYQLAATKTVTNQDVINAFDAAYGVGEYWERLNTTLGTDKADEMAANRKGKFT